jgi:hypothetical protein
MPPASASRRARTRDRAPLDQRDDDDRDHHHEQERRLLQEMEVRVGERQLDVAGRQRAGDEAGQEGADAHRRGHADPLEDVEDEMHRAVP